MANKLNREDGRKLVGCMVFCLRVDTGRTLFGWLDLTQDEKQALLEMLNKIFGEEVEINMEGLRKMFEAFLAMTNPTTMDDRDASTWANVANNVTQVKELKFDNNGRRAWYLALKKDGDLDWEEGQTEPVLRWTKSWMILGKETRKTMTGQTESQNTSEYPE